MIIVQLDSDQLNNLIQKAVLEAISRAPLVEKAKEIDPWFDLSELCQYHPDKPTKPTVYGWVHAGIIPVHKGGKKLRFLKSEIDTWLKQGRKKTLVETAKEADQYLTKKKRGMP